jgi:hypothetical protein
MLLGSLGAQLLPVGTTPARAASCDRFVAPGGDNRASGSRRHPWKTMEYAARRVADHGCTVWFRDGTYTGTQSIERRFSTRTVFRAIHPLKAVFASHEAALDIGGNAGNLTVKGMVFRQQGPGSDGVLVYVSGADRGRPAPDHVAIVGNVIHDAWGDDLMKIRSAADHITVRGNVFYNQASGEQHIDVNGVTNVAIERNIFFHDFRGSGRADPRDTKQYIVVKDSNGGEDGFRGARRIRIDGNVFLHWEGGDEALVAIGNDGRGYLEAQHVDITNNLVIGQTGDHADTAVAISGAGDVDVRNNTVTGTFPCDAFAMDVDRKERNPRNQDILFANNLWTDPTASMGSLSNGDRGDTRGLKVRRNLYWNGGKHIAWGDLLRRSDDPAPVFGNPRLEHDLRHVALPYWQGGHFRSGTRTIVQEFLRLVRRYGRPDPSGAAIDRAQADLAPDRDILGHWRGPDPDLGAFESG